MKKHSIAASCGNDSIVVTGATGMIGAAIVAEALAQNKRVAAIVRPNSPNRQNLQNLVGHPNLEIIECGLEGYANLNLTVKHGAFLHMAWQSTDAASRDDVYLHLDNIKYTIDAVHAAHRAGCEVFVSAGSQAEYGLVTEKLGENTACKPESGYGIAKYAAGQMARIVASQLGMRSCHARILSTYGEGLSDNSIIIYLIKTLLAGEKPLLTKCGQIWDYMYVRDTARAFLAIAAGGENGKAYPLGSGIARPLREYVETIRDMIDPALELGFGEKEYYPHQPMYLCADIRELTADTGFKPTVGFAEGIGKTIAWVKTSCAPNGHTPLRSPPSVWPWQS
ncbi:MAG: NAD(P)-dependent oxidoreductase [Lachnospiraceae bacterium]|jgi:nucleoside-diphosphate-sugar epimerase|nr:NAD(P)-dependent oxidoreductase [Lachnospiraceae bacterium]